MVLRPERVDGAETDLSMFPCMSFLVNDVFLSGKVPLLFAQKCGRNDNVSLPVRCLVAERDRFVECTPSAESPYLYPVFCQSLGRISEFRYRWDTLLLATMGCGFLHLRPKTLTTAALRVLWLHLRYLRRSHESSLPHLPSFRIRDIRQP